MKKHLLALALIAAAGGAQAGSYIVDDFNTGAQNISPVSYTHLDVYKRQARTFTVKLTDGSYPSLGAALTTDSETAIVGYDGGIYLETPKAGEVITITHDRGVCSASVPTPLPTFDETAELECK